MKTAKKRPTPSEKSLANLKPIRSSEEARRYGAIGNEKKKELKERKKLLLDDIREVVTAEIAVPKALYESLRELSVPIKRTETIDKVVFYRALLKSIKDGNADQLLKIAEFAGMRFTEEETNTSAMTPDTEMMLSTIFAQGRKVEPKQPKSNAVDKADGESSASNEQVNDEGAAHSEPAITVFSGLG